MADRKTIEVTVNDQIHTREIPVRMLLSDFIRDELGLTGTHVGCEQGVCGACTILVDGRPARSCLMLAVQSDGAEIETVESLSSDGRLSDVQEAFHENFGLQCGFCTPGILMNTVFFLRVNPDPTETEIREDLAGHLCRCTGYQHIIDSITAAARKGAGTKSP